MVVSQPPRCCLKIAPASFADAVPLPALAHRKATLRKILVVAWVLVVLAGSVRSADTEEAKKLFRSGDFKACIEMAKGEVSRNVWNEFWPKILIECYLATGAYESALTEYEAAVQRFQSSIRLRMLGHQAYRMNNQAEKGTQQLGRILELLQTSPTRFAGRDDLVALGEYFLLQGEDPKQVLEICYDRALKSDPKMVEAHVASARLALDKYDYQVAAQSLAKAVKLDDTDPEIHYLLARAWSPSDDEKTTEHLIKALERNPKHIPTLLMRAENRMGAEDYVEAEKLLKEVESVNPRLPKLWALRAAIAHLEARHKEEGEFRRKGLEPFGLNPEVDYVIGKHLSEHYRFADGVTYQLRAVEMDRDYVPAKTQLAQDLLRLGRTEQGWKLVDQVRKKDPYDVSIFNLKQLETQLAKFATLEAPGFVVRMDTKEAQIYGHEVLEILSEARTTLTKKYDVQLEEPIYVEIFPKQKDFAIRTFGMPGGSGFLGVCFGRLITANSPAALKVDSNWKSVLWHEYCHVVTLQKTKNKMPRWLSEGISVYEERQRDSRWGQSMDPTYRKMVLSQDLVPVSKLSGAFLQPKTPMHLQFAYYESSMVVEFWIEKYGLASLLRVLNDLSVGMPIYDALARDAASMNAIDQEFAVYIQNLARKLGDGESDEIFEEVDMPEGSDPAEWKEWFNDHSKNYWGLRKVSETLLQAKEWEAALPWVEKLRAVYPQDADAGGVYGMLATIYRAKEEPDNERKALVELSRRSADCKEALMRLIELDSAAEAWPEVARWCEKLNEIDPLRPNVQDVRAKAAEKMSDPKTGALALQAVLELDPVDPAGTHYRLARNFHALGDQANAKLHVLKALDESPRYRQALELLLKLKQAETDSKPSDTESDVAPSPSKEPAETNR